MLVPSFTPSNQAGQIIIHFSYLPSHFPKMRKQELQHSPTPIEGSKESLVAPSGSSRVLQTRKSSFSPSPPHFYPGLFSASPLDPSLLFILPCSGICLPSCGQRKMLQNSNFFPRGKKKQHRTNPIAKKSLFYIKNCCK